MSSRLRGRNRCVLCPKQVLGVLLAVFAVLAFDPAVFAQGSAGRIIGAITDQTGGAVAGATVTISDTARGTSRTLTTDASGEYNAPNLLPSTYNVTATFQGFKAAERSGVLLEVGKDLRVDLTLQPGEQTEKITVTEALPMVETTNAELGGTLQSAIIADLPMNGRNFANLIQLRPGVTIYPGGSGWTQSSNGMRATDNVYLFEGVNGNDPWMSQPIISAVMASGDAGTLISIDAIDEFKTEENPRAEYGWKPGAIVNVGLKSGTNNYHGTGYAYGRNGSWDANNFFNNATGAPNTPVELEQFGATFGGPIKKDKLFYFLSFEDQRYAVGATGGIQTPITAPGVFDPALGNTSADALAATNLIGACQAALAVGPVGSGIPGALTHLSASLAGLSDTCVPLGNYPGLFPVNAGTTGLGPTFIPNTLPNTNHIDSGLSKVDYHLNDKNSLNFMYEISPGSGLLNDAPGVQTNSAFETNQYARSQVFAAGWTWTPNSTWVNEARVGYSHYFQQFVSNDNSQNPAAYSFNGSTYNLYTGQTNPLYFGLPAMTISPFGGNIGAGWPKVVGPDGVLQLLDHISYLRGKHAFKFGGEILDNRSTSDVTANTKGPITFDTLQDFFAGYPNGTPGCSGTELAVCQGGGSATILVGNMLRHFDFKGYAAFLQDDWRVTQRVTLNLGVRYEINTVPVERDGLQGNFLPNTPTGLAQQNIGEGLPYHGDHNNFSPRLGFAWDIFGNGKTVLRGGGGIVYEQLALDVFNGIGNSFGLRANPTGDLLCAGGATGSCIHGPGNIAVANVSYAGTAVLAPLTAAAVVPGTIPYNWANNSASTPIYSFTAACGDGSTTSPLLPGGLAAGFKPPQCNAMLVDPNLRTPYVDEWTLDLQRSITNNISIDIGYVGNHGTKLVSALDINQPIAVTANVPGVGLTTFGPGYVATAGSSTAASLQNCAANPSKSTCGVSTAAEQAARPYSGLYPYFKFIDDYGNLDSSNYNGMQAVLTARNYHGLTLTTGYTYSHALGINAGQGTAGSNVVPINSYGSLRGQLYSPTTFDTRHKLTISGTYDLPGRKGVGQMLEGWSINGAAIIQTGSPFHIADTTTDFAGTGEQLATGASGTQGSQWDFFGNPSDFTPHNNFDGVAPGPTGVPGVPFFPGNCASANPAKGKNCNTAVAPTANAACNADAASNGPLGTASLRVLGCYALGNSVLIPPPYGGYGTAQYNQWYDQGFKNVDFSVTKAFKIKENFSAEFRAEFFNIFNWVNFVNPWGGPGGGGGSLNPSRASGGAGLFFVSATPDEASSNPVLGSGGARDIQLGLKLKF